MPAAKKPGRCQTNFVHPGEPIPEGMSLLWEPHPIQIRALIAQEDEILFGGSKGGGKTACGIAWLIKGNYTNDQIRPCDATYINHPNYRALVLRKNMIDMADWIDKAKRIYKPLGAEFKERPLCFFEFPSGAKIVLGHLDDGDTYTKYQGQEFHRFLLEEATLVPDLLSYQMVRSCVRSTFAELKTQTFLTANPGGPGHSWIRDRFVKPKDKDGNVVIPGTRIIDQVTGESRIYIPARLSDNPALMADPSYINKLRGLPDAQKRAFLDGDWDALSGIFFTEFRPNGPLIGEPEQAQHVIASRPLSPWLHRSIGMDWGYAHDGAAYWGCEVEDGRFHVYREMVAKNRGAEQWGVEIGLASMEDLRGVDGNTMSLFLSPDAWDRRNDTRSVADQIADGIRRVLGPDSVMLATEEEIPGEFAARVEQQRGMGITVRKAPNQRLGGASYLRSQLRWWPLSQVERGTFDQELFLRMLQEDAKRAMDYRESFYKMQQSEILPGLLIHDCCPRLINTLQCVQHDEKRPEDVEKSAGDDCYDAFRYLVFARTKEQAREPFSVFLQRRMEAITAARGGAMDGNVIVQVARKAEADYAGDPGQSSPFFIPRAGGRRAKMAVN